MVVLKQWVIDKRFYSDIVLCGGSIMAPFALEKIFYFTNFEEGKVYAYVVK